MISPEPRVSVRGAALALLLAASVLVPTSGLSAVEPAPVMSHMAEIVFDVEAHTVHITDRIDVPEGVTELRLGEDMDIEQIKVTDNIEVDPFVVVRRDWDEDGTFQVLDLTLMGMRHGGLMLVVYGGTFHQPVDDVVFSREKVGGEISATIGDEGIYLSSGAGWLPWAEGVMATHDLGCDTPAGFETVTQGRREQHQEREERLWTRWVADNPSDGINLIANRFVVHEEPVREGVTSYTFLLSDDARLRATYQERTHAYIAMYEEMIGPYPYAKFATVENWFPTGYGMPSYTLLGGQVLRLPFIPYTSFGHEIAHNWWGNSVFVDVSEGNWCEGLTVYCADYHYKELESPEAAREYRRNLLKAYAAYVKDPELDFPLREFRSRHSGATRAVGYGKSMMVFHMVDRLIGRETFLEGLRKVAAEHRYVETGWSDFLGTFAALGDRELGGFGDQWLTRTGAPTLALADVRFDDDVVSFELRQTEPLYDLDVPVVLSTPDGDQEHVLRLVDATADFRLDVAGVKRVAIDPDCHLFRNLDPAEIEPTLNQVLGDEAPHFIAGTGDGSAAGDALREAALEFARGFSENDAVELVPDGELPGDGHAGVVINPDSELLLRLGAPGLEIAGGLAFLDGQRFKLSEYDLVYTVVDPVDPTVSDLVILCSSPRRLTALARRVVHYGKYSWLALPAGQGDTVRGNWPPGPSPLVAAR